MRSCKSGFLQAYLDYTEAQESPELFHLWSAVSIISAALGRKCYLNRGYFVCYPNQYIILVSESARCRKTTAADIAVKLYREAAVGTVIMEKITSASLSRYLHDANQKTGESNCYIYSPELGTFLGSDSYTSGLMLLITTLYGCPPDWEYRTKTQGTDTLKNVFVNILGCTIPAWLSNMPGDMVEGGFSSRTIFVVQSNPRPPRSRPTITTKQLALYEALVKDLRTIAGLSGEFKWSEKAEICFDDWYDADYQRIDSRDTRLRAYYARKGEHVLKLAMCLSASSSGDMLIQEYDILNALSFLKQVELNMPTAFRGVSFSQSTKHMDRIMSQIQEGGGKIEHAALLRKNRFYLDREELAKVMSTLMESNLVRMEIDTTKGRKTYRLLE